MIVQTGTDFTSKNYDIFVWFAIYLDNCDASNNYNIPLNNCFWCMDIHMCSISLRHFMSIAIKNITY